MVRQRNIPLTDEQKWLIKHLHQQGVSAEAIVLEEKLKRSNGTYILKQTVNYWIKRLNETNDVKTKKRPGRPRKLSERQERRLVDFIRANNRLKYREVKMRTKARCHIRTLNKYGLKNGIRQRKAAKKPAKIDKKKRIEFCEKLLNNDEMRGKLIFTDEKMFSPDSHAKVDFVKRIKGTRYEESNISRPRKGNGYASVMIWAYIGPFGKGEIFIAENYDRFDQEGNPIPNPPNDARKGFDNKSYVRMLQNHALSSIRSKIENFVFVSDNSRVHTAKINIGETVDDLFREENVQCLYTPTNSPDLHPIELAFSALQREYYNEINRLVRLPKNKAETFSLVKRVWNDLVDNNEIIKIYWSITKKCIDCLRNSGNNNFKG